jgi:energy-coupling factor transporter ATP-binding protein EcfA2
MIASNPFSTRYVQPGRISFQLRDGVTIEQLFDRFLQIPTRRAAIVGPHGSGKSSLLETMRKSIPSQYAVDAHRLSSESTRRDRTGARWELASQRWGTQTIVIVDGFEQVGWWAQYRLRQLVRNHESRLLITTHSPIRRFPLLWMTQRAVDDDDYVLRQLLIGYDDSDKSTKITEIDEAMIRWREVRLRHPTDMREALMEMYDWWEQKKTARNF